MRKMTTLFWLAGMAVLAVLIYVADIGEIIRAPTMIGWGFSLLILLRIVLLFVDAHSWRCLLDGTHRPGIRQAAFQRWVGESVSAMLPFATIGGELARVRVIVLSGMPSALAFASIIMDGVVALFSQFLFLCLGLTLFVGAATESRSLNHTILVGSIALLITAICTGMIVRAGLLGRLAEMLKGDLAKDRVLWLAEAMGSVDRQMTAIAQNRRACINALAWRVLGWLLGAGEIWLVLRFLGHPIPIADALILDAVTAAVRSAFFFVPGGLGVQEGALLLMGAALGIEGDPMIVAVVIKRAREVFFSVPGLIAWEWTEKKSMRQTTNNA